MMTKPPTEETISILDHERKNMEKDTGTLEVVRIKRTGIQRHCILKSTERDEEPFDRCGLQ